LTFLWCEDDLETQSLVLFLNQLLTDALDENPIDQIPANFYPFYAAIFNVISLLLTTVSDEFILESFLSDAVLNIETFMSCTDSELKCSAAELFALVCSGAKRSQETDGENYSIYYFNGFLSNVQETFSYIQDCANGDQRSVNKKDRDRQMKDFIPILKTFQDGTEPCTSLTIKNQAFEFTTWIDLLRLNFLKGILGTGFQFHFANNELLSSIFDVFVEQEVVRLSSLQKKAFLQRTAKETKLRKQAINKNRSYKQVDLDESD